MSTVLFNILANNVTLGDRARSFHDSVKEDLELEMKSLRDKKRKIEDEIHDKLDFSLETNHNAGVVALTREDVCNRFKEVMNLRYKLVQIELELKVKEDIVSDWLKEEVMH